MVTPIGPDAGIEVPITADASGAADEIEEAISDAVARALLNPKVQRAALSFTQNLLKGLQGFSKQSDAAMNNMRRQGERAARGISSEFRKVGKAADDAFDFGSANPDLRTIERGISALTTEMRNLTSGTKQAMQAIQELGRQERAAARLRAQESRDSVLRAVQASRSQSALSQERLAAARDATNREIANIRSTARITAEQERTKQLIIRQTWQTATRLVQAFTRAAGSALRGLTRVVQSTFRGVIRIIQSFSRAGEASFRAMLRTAQVFGRALSRVFVGFGRAASAAFRGVSRGFAAAVRRDESTLRSSLSRRDRAVAASAQRQRSALSGVGFGGAAVAGAAAAAGPLALLTGGFERFAEEESLQLALSTILGDADAAAAKLQELSDYSRITAFDFVGVSQAVLQFTAATGDIGRAEEVTKFLADLVAITGGSAAQFERSALAFQQIISAGVIQGDELRQLTESLPGIPVIDILTEKFFGGDQAAFAEAKAAGELGAHITAEGFFEALEEGIAERFPQAEGAAIRMAGTIRGIADNTREAFEIFGATIIGVVEGPLKAFLEGTQNALRAAGDFISGKMFEPGGGAVNPFAAQARQEQATAQIIPVAVEDLPEQARLQLEEIGFEGPFVSSEDAAIFWDRFNPPPEVNENLRELREIIFNMAGGVGIVVGLAGALKLLGGAFNTFFGDPALLNRFQRMIRVLGPLVIIGGLLGLAFGRIVEASEPLRNALDGLSESFGPLFEALRGLGGALFDTFFQRLGAGSTQEGLARIGDFLARIVDTLTRGVGALTEWINWVSEMVRLGEFRVVLRSIGGFFSDINESMATFIGNLVGITPAEIEREGGGIAGLLRNTILEPIVNFFTRTLPDAIRGFAGFLGDMWDLIFGGEGSQEGFFTAGERSLRGSTIEQRSLGSRILDMLEDTFLGPVVRFARGPAADAVETAIEGVVGAFRAVVRFFTEGGLQDAYNNAVEFLQPAIDAVSGAISRAWDVIEPIAQPLIDKITEIVDAFKNLDFSDLDLGNVALGAGVGLLAGGLIAGPFGAVGGAAIGAAFGAGIGGAIAETLGNAWDEVVQPALQGLWDDIQGFIETTFTADNLAGAGLFLLEFLRNAGREVANFVSDPVFVAAILGLVAVGVAIVGAFTLGLVEGLADAVQEWSTLISDALEDAWEAIAPEFIPDPLANAISDVLGSPVTGAIVLVGGVLLGKAVVSSVLSGVASFGPALLRGAGGLAGLIFGKGADRSKLGIGEGLAFASRGAAIAGAIAAGFLAFKFGEAGAETGSFGGLILGILSGTVTGAAIGTAIAPGIGTAIGAGLGTAIAGIGAIFGDSGRRAREAAAEINEYADAIRGVTSAAEQAEAGGAVVIQNIRDRFGQDIETLRFLAEGGFDAQDFFRDATQGVVFLEEHLANLFTTLGREGQTLIPEEWNNDLQALGTAIEEIGGFGSFDELTLGLAALRDEGGITGEQFERFSEIFDLLAAKGVDLDAIIDLLFDERGDLAAALNLESATLAFEAAATGGFSLEEAINAVRDAVERGDTPAQIQAMLQASGTGTETSLRAIEQVSRDVETAARDARGALDEVFATQIAPQTLSDFTDQVLAGLPSFQRQLEGIELEFGVNISEAQTREVTTQFASDLNNAIVQAIETGAITTPEGLQTFLAGLESEIEAADLSEGATSALQSVIDTFQEADYSSVFDPIGDATVKQETLDSVADTLATSLQEPLAQGFGTAVDTAVLDAFSRYGIGGEDAGAEGPAGTAGTGLAEGFATAFSDSDAPTAVATEVVEAVGDRMQASRAMLGLIGAAAGIAFASGLGSQGERAVNVARFISGAVAAQFSSLDDALYSAGANAGAALGRGLNSQVRSAASAAIAVAQAAANAARAALQIASPSKVFRDIGRQVGLGFIEGIKETEGDIATAISDGISNAIDLAIKRASAAVTRAQAAGSIFELLAPSILPGGTPSSRVLLERLGAFGDVGGFRPGLNEAASGLLGTPSGLSVGNALATVRNIGVAFAGFTDTVRGAFADARQQQRDIEKYDVAIKNVNAAFASGWLGTRRYYEQVAELQEQLAVGTLDADRFNEELKVLKRELRLGILNREEFEDVMAELGERPAALNFAQLQILRSGVNTLNPRTAQGAENRNEILGFLDQIRQFGQELLNSGRTLPQVIRQMDLLTDSLVNQGVRLGFNRRQLDALVHQAGLSDQALAQLRKTLTTLNTATQQGRENTSRIVEQLVGIREFGQRMIEAGVATNTAVSQLRQLRNSLVNQAVAFGFNRRSVLNLVNAVGLGDAALKDFVRQLAAFDAQAKKAAATAKKAEAEARRREELDRQARQPLPDARVGELHVHIPSGNPEVVGMYVANRLAYDSLSSW